jgi:hypothetical protein
VTVPETPGNPVPETPLRKAGLCIEVTVPEIPEIPRKSPEIHRLRAAKLAGWALTVFSLSYAAFAYFIGQMAWTDTFL